MNNWSDWLPLWLACGAVTFATRHFFIGLAGRYPPPTWFAASLPFVPIAALAAITAPELLMVDGSLAIAGNAKLYAGCIAIALAVLWRNALLTIASGFAVYWLLRGLA